MSPEFAEEIVDHVRKEESFWRNFKIFSGLYTSLFVTLIAVIVWVLLEKNADIKDMQASIIKHSNQIERMLVIVENQVTVNADQQRRIEKNTEDILRRR